MARENVGGEPRRYSHWKAFIPGTPDHLIRDKFNDATNGITPGEAVSKDFKGYWDAAPFVARSEKNSENVLLRALKQALTFGYYGHHQGQNIERIDEAAAMLKLAGSDGTVGRDKAWGCMIKAVGLLGIAALLYGGWYYAENGEFPHDTAIRNMEATAGSIGDAITFWDNEPQRVYAAPIVVPAQAAPTPTATPMGQALCLYVNKAGEHASVVIQFDGTPTTVVNGGNPVRIQREVIPELCASRAIQEQPNLKTQYEMKGFTMITDADFRSYAQMSIQNATWAFIFENESAEFPDMVSAINAYNQYMMQRRLFTLMVKFY